MCIKKKFNFFFYDMIKKRDAYETNRTETAFLQIYKGNNQEEAIQKLDPTIPKELLFIYDVVWGYENINKFMSFLSDPTSIPIQDIYVRRVEDMIEMVKSIIHASCEYALENPIQNKKIYRYENNKNLECYEKGEIPCMKSTSQSHSEATVFHYKDTTPLVYQIEDGFIPYIAMEEVVEGEFFKDEKEILFPPFLKVEKTDQMENTWSGDYQVIKIKDSFDDIVYVDTEEQEKTFQEAMKDFEECFSEAKKRGEVTPELLEKITIIRDYIRDNARKMYAFYQTKYQMKQLEEELKKM